MPSQFPGSGAIVIDFRRVDLHFQVPKAGSALAPRQGGARGGGGGGGAVQGGGRGVPGAC